MTEKALRLGTRRSKLAMAQSGQVAKAVSQVTGRPVELVEITTYGDVSREHLALRYKLWLGTVADIKYLYSFVTYQQGIAMQAKANREIHGHFIYQLDAPKILDIYHIKLVDITTATTYFIFAGAKGYVGIIAICHHRIATGYMAIVAKHLQVWGIAHVIDKHAGT